MAYFATADGGWRVLVKGRRIRHLARRRAQMASICVHALSRVCNCPQWSRVPTVVSVTSWSCCAGANSTATFPRYVVDKMRIQEDESMHCIAFRFDILTEYQSYPHAMLDAGNGRSDENPTGLVQALVPAVHHSVSTSDTVPLLGKCNPRRK